MVFEPNFTKVSSANKRLVGTTQSVIEVKLPTNDDINAIYSTNARVTILSREVSGNNVNFTGSVNFQVVYGNAGIDAVDYTADFKDKFTAENEILGEVIIDTNVIDVTSTVVSGGIRVVAIVETIMYEIVASDISVLTDVKNNNAYILNKDMSYTAYLGKASEKFDLVGEFDLGDVEKILMVSPSVCLSNVELRDNCLIVTGVVDVDICYQSGENPNDIKTYTNTISLNGEVAFDGAMDTSAIQSDIRLVGNEINVSTSIEDGTTMVNVTMPVVYTGYVFENRQLSIVDDVYLQSNYLSITRESVVSIDTLESTSFRDTISGVASISDTSSFIDEILCVSTNNIVIASSRVVDGLFMLEGIANTTVVYYSKETENITSVLVEMPFAIEQKVNGSNANIVSVCLGNINARSKRGKEIEVSADLNVFADVYSEKDNLVISNIVVGEEKVSDDCSLFVYIVKPNQTLWDIAKEMNVSQELILEQNPEVELPLNAGDKLVIYTPRFVEYK